MTGFRRGISIDLTALGLAAAIAVATPTLLRASPDSECPGSSQVEISDCVAQVEEAVDASLATIFSFALAAAQELDTVTGRPGAVEALEAGQAAWSAYRDAHCAYVGTTYGGSSGTGIAIRSCRIELGRARERDLLRYVR